MKQKRKLLRGLASLSAAALIALPLNKAAPEFVSKAAGEVCINELCAKNTVYPAPDNNCYDWIELYNPTDSAVDLSGYGLSDKETKPFKFTFPEGTSIAAEEYLVVFCDSVIPQITGAFTAGFGLSTSGETVFLTAPDGTQTDSVTFGSIAANESYGRLPDGSDSFATLKMSPNAKNQESDVLKVDIEEPTLSHSGGFYDSGFSLDISIPAGTTVYYTLDGSVPDTSSDIFSTPIDISDISSQPNKLSARTDIKVGDITAPSDTVDKAIVVNAVAVDDKGNVSDMVSAAYFIGYGDKSSYYQNMKVISLTTDEDNLFSYDNGIYVLGAEYDRWKASSDYSPSTQDWETPGNYSMRGRNWERPATLQIYENGQLSHSQNVGIRIHGGASRTAAQKSFNVYARSDYGPSKFDFDLFGGDLRSEYTGKKIKEFDTFILRNGGNDANATRFRDKLNQSLVADRNMLTQGMEPYIVFINGEYWGHYEITERLSSDFIKAHYGVDKNDVCLIKNEELEEGTEEDFNDWQKLCEWVKSTDFSQAENYRQLCDVVDIQSFADYMAAELYFGNQDFSPNNTAMWRSLTVDPSNEWADGKWRFILFDTEYSTNLYGSFGNGADINIYNTIIQNDCFYSNLIKRALNNSDFKRLFATTFMDMTNDNFSSEAVLSEINKLDEEYHEMTVDTLDRFAPKTQQPGFGGNWGWGGGGWGGFFKDNEQTYSDEVESVRSFYRDRPDKAANQLKSNCQLKGNLAVVTLNNDTSEGTIKLNTITPAFTNNKWEGKYYTDYPVTLTAKPETGYRFARWETSDGQSYIEDTIELSLKGNVTVTAVYEKSSEFSRGDVNRDGKVNTADLVLLSKWLLGAEELIDNVQADVYTDNVIDTYDLIQLRKQVIGQI